jgi:nitrile hydratase subunit beta
MNTAHDMGGGQGFGSIQETEPNAPLFHAEWEKRVLALTLAMGGTASWNIDESRAARESIPPAKYLTSSYFEIWFGGLQKLMLERGMVTQAEIDSGKALEPPLVLAKKLLATDVAAALAKGSPVDRPTETVALFNLGEKIKTKIMNPDAHTRLPRYARGRMGTIEAIRGFHYFPDTHAYGADEAQWLYTVRFDAAELWGPDTTASAVYVDCWQSYLMAANG